jgi:hypothetical protein
MNLVKEIRTSSLLIKIYSVNPDLVVEDNVSIFEGKDDYDIRNIVFNQIGAEQLEIFNVVDDPELTNPRSYALM